MPYRYSDLIQRAYRGDAAHGHVSAISQHHRIQASPGYRAAADYVAGQLAAAGLDVAIRSYPATADAHFWTSPGFLEWTADAATLHLLDDQGRPAELLCDFEALPISLIQRSVPVAGEFAVIAPGGQGGKAPEDYAGLDVAGKLVLTSAPAGRVAELAVRQRGAAGIIFDGMAAGGRSELDLPDARQYTSFWWAGATQPAAFGFVLSPRQGRRLRASLAKGQAVRVRARVVSRFYAGAFEVVEAALPGAADAAGEILLVSHLCHPRPGAHDNGSGAGALIEAAATLARLIAQRDLPRPARSIRLLWPPEMTGTFAWLAEHEAEVRNGRWIAGLNLDMVGADQRQTGGAWELVSLPQAGAAFADHLLSWLRQPFVGEQRIKETPFSAGSDHYILADPTVGIPAPMLNQWPDTFYHTSADTPDKVSPASLAGSGGLAAVYAYWLASAGAAEARWLGHLMAGRFAAAAGQRAAAAVEAQPPQFAADYRRASAFYLERMTAALGTLARLAPGLEADIAAWRAEVAAAAAREDAWAADRLPVSAAEAEAAWRAEAAQLYPRRLHPGPIDLGMVAQTCGPELQQALWQLDDEAGTTLHDGAALLQYWADGAHTIADIADRVGWETGQAVGEVALRYFRLVAQTGLVAL
jgi:hypothetical protein